MRTRREKAFTKSNISAIVKLYPKVALFPSNVQVMIQREFYLAREKFNNGEEIRYEMDTAVSGCSFYMKYSLPCKHIFLTDFYLVNETIPTTTAKVTLIAVNLRMTVKQSYKKLNR
jgi:hypothetical protein